MRALQLARPRPRSCLLHLLLLLITIIVVIICVQWGQVELLFANGSEHTRWAAILLPSDATDVPCLLLLLRRRKYRNEITFSFGPN